MNAPLFAGPNGQLRDARGWLLLVSLVVVALDRVTKLLVAKNVALGSAIVVVPGVFRITHVLNIGAAFSLFADAASPMAVRIGLILFSLLAAGIVMAMLWKYGRTFSLASVGFALVLGGAVGNLYDRIHLHYVIDFLEVYVFGYHWPDFNVADSAITVGAVLLLAEMMWPDGSAKATAAGEPSAT